MTKDSVPDAAIEKATFALATPGALPKWMEITALGRSMTPIARVAVEAAYPFIAEAVEARTREAIAMAITEISLDYMWETADGRLQKAGGQIRREAAHIARSAVLEGSNTCHHTQAEGCKGHGDF